MHTRASKKRVLRANLPCTIGSTSQGSEHLHPSNNGLVTSKIHLVLKKGCHGLPSPPPGRDGYMGACYIISRLHSVYRNTGRRPKKHLKRTPTPNSFRLRAPVEFLHPLVALVSDLSHDQTRPTLTSSTVNVGNGICPRFVHHLR